MKKLWRCPKCGHRFVSANMWHSCTNYTLDIHFEGKDPALRRLFDRYLAMVRRIGPVTVISQKTRIAFQVRARFAGALVRKSFIEGGLWLKRQVEHPLFFRTMKVTPTDWVYYFRLRSPADLENKELRAFLREAYAVGAQEHETQRRYRR
jgi:hypothetical protein